MTKKIRNKWHMHVGNIFQKEKNSTKKAKKFWFLQSLH